MSATLPSSGVLGDDGGRPWRLAIPWVMLLGVLFFSTYGGANWLASQRGDVGALVFGWERGMPFWAWSIVPYWSIDAFYAVSLFVCASRAELMVHVKRLLAAQAICIACFVAFPLRFSFERPMADGIPGWMFAMLTGFDKPYNQAPSLHIVLLVILWVCYARHLSAGWRWLLHAWFAAIGVSVLTTYQHHFIDIPTGLWVGWLCVWLFPDHGPSIAARLALTADPQRQKLALRYGAAAVLIAAPGLATGGLGSLLLWVSAALFLVALIYLALDESAFQKDYRGRMSMAAYCLLWPYFVGAWINSRLWTRRMPPASEVVRGLLLGRLPAARDLAAGGIAAVVDLSAELPVDAGGRAYYLIPVLDLTVPSIDQLAAAVRAIDSAMRTRPVLVCCALGFSRSALVCGGWLLRSGQAGSVSEALAILRRARPGIVLGPAQLALLERYAQGLAA